MQQLREPETYGDIRLSIQASASHYCTPRVDGLPLDSYSSVEIALLQGADERFVLPSGLELDECLDEEFHGDEVAGFVDWEYISRLRAALRQRCSSERSGGQ